MSLRTKLHPMGGGKGKDKIIDVAYSDYTTWYLTESGDLYGCGRGGSGQQGSGDTNDVLTFTKRASNVAQVVCSDNATWYIDKSGDLYGCGSDLYGQQGNNTIGSSGNVNVFTKRASNVAQVVCSGTTTWYINTSGDLYGCGYNSSGQQGSGNTSSILTFTKRASNVEYVTCSAKGDTTWYINSSKQLFGCGNSQFGQQGSGSTNVTQFAQEGNNIYDVKATNYTTWTYAIVNSTRYLYGCGRNNSGQQGAGIGSSSRYGWTQRSATVNRNKEAFACSAGTTWYINTGLVLYGCGENEYGQQGSGNTTDVFTFTSRVANVKQVECTNNTTWYINILNELYGCGRNIYGQQGDGTSGTAAMVTTFTKRASDVAKIFHSNGENSAGFTTWYIDTSGDLYGCGYNNNGQQGSGDTSNVLTFTKRN